MVAGSQDGLPFRSSGLPASGFRLPDGAGRQVNQTKPRRCVLKCSTSRIIHAALLTLGRRRDHTKGRGSKPGNMLLSKKKKKKKSTFPPQLSRKSVFPPSTLKPGKSPPSTFQTVYFTSLERFRRRFCYSKRWFCYSETVLSFSFLLILAESLKNHSKSQKNHKMKIPILLHST
jgi:hypothetical protein